MYDTLLAARHGAVAEITLNRPKLHNAFNDVLVAELTAVLEAVEQDPGIHTLVLAGSGASFCAGADTQWMRGMAQASKLENKDDSLRLARVMRLLNFLSKPTIARVHGAVYGGGIGLVACCDIAIGADDSRFSLSEVKLGLVPATISPYVINAIGLRQARRLFVTGEVFDAAHAARIGLLHEAVPPDHLHDRVQHIVRTIEKTGPVARREAKRLALHMAGMDERSATRVDTDNAELIARLRVSDEGQEGLGAFLEKRKPEWITDNKEGE